MYNFLKTFGDEPVCRDSDYHRLKAWDFDLSHDFNFLSISLQPADILFHQLAFYLQQGA